MRQSLSALRNERPSGATRDTRVVPALVAALVGSIALAVAGCVDQLGDRSLVDHATALYEPHGKEAGAAVLYGVLYAIAATNTVLWLATLVTLRAASRWAAAVVAAAGVVIGLVVAAALLAVQEYGELVFPLWWGLVALLPPLAGAVAVVQLIRRAVS